MSGVRWDRVDELIDRSPGLADLRSHGLHLLAARRWRTTGKPVPPTVVSDEMQAAWRLEAAPRVLAAIRAACDGPLLLIKGPAVAACYPTPAARPFIDLDLVVPDAAAVHRALLAAGFRLSADPADYPDHLHHLPPLHLPSIPLPVEVHSRPKWVDGIPLPGFERLAEGARDGALGVAGVTSPDPARHALVLAAHLWAHDPLTHLLRLLDVAVISNGVEERTIEAQADSWGRRRLWIATRRAAGALFGDDASPWPLRTWARGLCSARELTVWELHLSRLLAPPAIHAPRAVAPALAAAVAGFARPHDGEPWRLKLARARAQVARPGMRRSDHVRALAATRRRGQK